ncbi:hypothetical protein RB595_010055 [Gaeumannomyces hyphopodioides]
MIASGLRRKALQPPPAFLCFQQRPSAPLSTWQSHEGTERFNQIVEAPAKPLDPKEKALARGLAFTSNYKRFDVQPSPQDRWEPVPGLKIWAAPRHGVPYRSMHYMEWPGHVLVDKLLDVFAEKSRTTPLWIMAEAASEPDTRTRAVVRLTQERRLRVALLQALQMHGYDRQGRKLRPSSPAARSAPQPVHANRNDPDELYGMVKLSCVAIQVANFPMDKMVAHFVRLVERLKGRLGCRAGERPGAVDDRDRPSACKPKKHVPRAGTRGEFPSRSGPQNSRSRDSGFRDRGSRDRGLRDSGSWDNGPKDRGPRDSDFGRSYAQQGPRGSSHDRNPRGRNASFRDAEDADWAQIISNRRT